MHRWSQHSQDESGSLSDQSLCIVFSAPNPEDQGPAQVVRGAAAAADPPSSSIGQQRQPPGQQAALWRQISAHESVLELPNSLPAQQAGSCRPQQVQATQQAEQPAQSSGQGPAGTGANTTCPRQMAGPLEFQRQELAAASLASSASSVSLLSQQLLPGSGSLSGPMISSLSRGWDPSSAGSGYMAAQFEPVKELQPHHADPDSLARPQGSHRHRPPLGPVHAVEVRATRCGIDLVWSNPFCSALLVAHGCLQGVQRGHDDASVVVLGSWADRVTHLALHYDSTAAAAARKMLRQRAAAARVRVAPAAIPATLEHLAPAGSGDMGQGPTFSPFAEAGEALPSSESSSSRPSPAASLPVGPHGRQAACITRRWSTGEPACRPQFDSAVLRWRTDFVRWAEV